MGKISIGRVLLGGVVAGLVGDGLGYLVDGIWLAPLWSDGMLSLGKNEFSPDQWIYFNVLGLVTGIVAVWIYAAIRPRLGPGPLTAASAGAAVWVVGSLVPNLSLMWFGGLFGHRLTAFTTAAALVEIVAGTIAGAALYKE